MNPFAKLNETKSSAAGYLLRAWLAAAIPSLLLFVLLVSIGVDSLHASSPAFDPTYAAYSIVVAPLLETALMFPVASLITLMIPQHGSIGIVLLAAIFALAHRIGGGWELVFASFWPFLIYSVTLNTWSKRSNGAAFVVTALVHALYNATIFGAGALGILLTNSA